MSKFKGGKILSYTIINADCIEALKELSDNSVDSVVTDPPYELGFMGKKWDSTGIAYNVELWKECLRVLKPGGHLLAFGGTRTYHRMTCAIEDAGFEIRDCIQWLYGMGFPKSHDISKAIDKKLGAERKVLGVSPNWRESKRDREKDGKMEVRGKNAGLITKPATLKAKQWEGWGTALKPANEPIVLARKPISEKTIAENVLKWGTGGLNIDGCRIGTEVRNNPQAGFIRRGRTDEEVFLGTDKNRPEGTVEVTGRFPANVILDEVAGEMLGEPSRFFYIAKTSKKERTMGGKVKNNHPTVKPIKLMQYLIRLVTPEGGTVLDPFAGSGTTLLAGLLENVNVIGIEHEEDYCTLIEERIKNLDELHQNSEVTPDCKDTPN